MSPNDSPPVTLAIAEKSPLLLDGMRKLFESDPRFNLVGAVGDGERFLSLLDAHAFDVGVIGWDIPHLDGRGVLQALRGRGGAPRIVVFTGNNDPDVPRQVMTLGGAGFCSKREPPEALIDTVIAVSQGRMAFPFVDLTLINTDPLGALTQRERELLAELGKGRTNAEIASDLSISPNTVKFHLKNIYDKLEVSNRAQAVARYMRSRAT